MRHYQGEADYTQMRCLLSETYPLTSPPLNCTIGDLDWWRSTTNDPDVLEKVQLWFAAEKLVSFTWPGKNQIDVMIHPNHRALERIILPAAEADYRRWKPSGDETGMFRYWSDEDDAVRNALLQEFGYLRTADYLALHTYMLDQSPEAQTLPPGYRIRAVAGAEEVEARVAVHRAAFHPSRMTVAKHLAVMNSPTYRRELDLVAIAPDGAFAAYTIAWYDETNAMGIFEPVGCHPDYQRRGLAGAVMREGLRRLYDLGARVAHVNSWREDSPGAALYRSLHFVTAGRIFAWEKQL
jgi:ribosomal protein S18 acetylase RimI-like enzyme